MLQKTNEMYLVQTMAQGQVLCMRREKVTLEVRDLQLLRQLQDVKPGQVCSAQLSRPPSSKPAKAPASSRKPKTAAAKAPASSSKPKNGPGKAAASPKWPAALD